MNTLAREECRAELTRRMKQVRPDSARRWGRMSAHQMICHLSDAFRMVTDQKVVSRASGPLQRTIVKWIALYLPLRWPAGIHTRPEIDQALAGTKPGEFAVDVAELEALMALFATRGYGVVWPDHPIFGRMSEAAWLRWGYLHVDHHLRQFGA
jgi:Protein of unknown function (DUF1569)